MSPLDQVIEALAVSPSLLILDNFEHLAAEGASLVQTLLQTIPPLTLAVTSRRVLGIAGEREFPVAPLPTPSDEMLPEALMDCASVRLFLDRAQAVRPDFQLTPRNAAAIGSLCRYLEGIPLALELAAARIRTLTPAQMSAGLIPRLELLVNPRADKDARHRSLRTTIAWSVQMLSPEARRFFARLAVFEGGWDVQEAAEICLEEEPMGSLGSSPGATQRGRAFDLLERLLSESLLIAEEQNGTMRFRMLETLREFAWEQLPPLEQERLRSRHTCWMRTLAEEAEGKLDGSEQGVWLERLELERTNLTAALTWCTEAQEQSPAPAPREIGLRIVGALWRFWEMRGSVREGRQFAERLLERPAPEIDLTVLARAFNASGTLAKNESDYDTARAHFEQALALRRRTGHREGISTILSNLGILHGERNETDTALRCYEESLEIARELAIPRGIAAALNNMATLRCRQGDFAAARVELNEALALRQQIGDRRAIFSTLTNLAATAHCQQDFAAAQQGHEQALAIARDLEDRFATAVSLVNLGGTYLAQQDYPAAHACLTECLQLHTAVGSRLGQAYALEGLASHAAQTGDPQRAGILLGAAETLRQEIQALKSPAEQRQLDATMDPVNTDLRFLSAVETGRSLPLETVICLALRPL